MKTIRELTKDKEVVSSDCGCFKSVLIYNSFVVKSAFTVDDNEYDDDYYYENNSPSPEECREELENEFNYVIAKEHLGIFAPIIAGDSEAFAMKRVKLFNEIIKDKGYQMNKLEERYLHKVICALLYRSREVGGSLYSYNKLKAELRHFVRLGVTLKMSIDQIVKNLYWFLAEDATSCLIMDMHTGNIGARGRRIVTFDAGQVSRGTGSIRTHSREVKKLKDKWRSK